MKKEDEENTKTEDEPVEEMLKELDDTSEETEAEKTTEAVAEEAAENEAVGLEAELEEKPEKKKEETKPEKEEKPPKEKEEEEIVEERIYTVPLGKAWIMPPKKRVPRAMRMVKAFVAKHMKVGASKTAEGEEEEEPGRLIVSNEVNLRLWNRGIEKPPRKIRIRAAKDREGNVTVYLAESD